jgi:hypothetical protein
MCTQRLSWLLLLALFVFAACSNRRSNGDGGGGNVAPGKSEWDSLVWDKDAWQ